MSTTLRILTAADVSALADQQAMQVALRQAFVAHAHGRAVVPSRSNVATDKGLLLMMGASVPDQDALVCKLVTVYPENAQHRRATHQGVAVAFCPRNGQPSALVDAASLTAVRTAAVSALATELLARPDSRVLAILGTGVQAFSHAHAMLQVRPIDEIRVAGRSKDSTERFARKLRSSLAVDVRVSRDWPSALHGADLVVAATHPVDPVVRRQWLTPGMHVNSIGFNPTGCEVDGGTYRDAVVVVETRAAALAAPPSGAHDLRLAIEDRYLRAEDIHASLADLLDGSKPGRKSPREITLFRSVGSAIEDAAVVGVLLQQAALRGVGRFAHI